jgi:PII-like signaling protein
MTRDHPAKGATAMQIPEKASLLRIFIGEDDKADGKPLYEAIVLRARQARLAGATVLRGPLGFGRSSRLHTAKILRLSQDLPIVIEIVDAEDKIQAFLPQLRQLTGSCLVTLEKVTVIHYGEDESGLAREADRPGGAA